jgi:hypothetical protein
VRHTRPSRTLAAILCAFAALVLGGCSDVAKGQRDQQAVLDYEQRIGELNTLVAQPVTSPRQVPARLSTAVPRYAALTPPAVMRPAHRRLLRALRSELRSSRAGLRALVAGDGPGVTAARSRYAKARRKVSAALALIATQAGRCRASLTDCLPVQPFPSSPG